ncbi:MAG: hypothetical protein ABEJ05_04660 [Haloglomus sp.]
MSRKDVTDGVDDATDDDPAADEFGAGGDAGLAPAGLGGGALADLDPGPLLTGAFVGLAGVLFLLQPLVEYVRLGALRVRPAALSAFVLALGLWVGAAVFLARGQRSAAAAHAVGAAGWSGIVLGTAAGNGTLLLGSIVGLVVGMVALAVESRRYT